MTDAPGGGSHRAACPDSRWQVRAPRRLAETADLRRVATRAPLALALAREALRAPSTFLTAITAIRRHGALQKPLELAAYLRFLRGRRLARVMEVGVAAGGMLYAHAAVMHPEGHLIAIDACPPLGSAAMTARCRSLAQPRQAVTCLWQDSHDAATAARVREALDGARLDLVFLDGDHSAAGIARDFELYAPLVRPGGLVALHDIDAGNAHGVPAFWSTAAHRHTHHVFVDRAHAPYGLGIGVLFLP